jgi:translation initiation factor IF-2
MGKIRVYELAKELNLSNKELVQKLQEMGHSVRSHSSTLEEFLVKEIKERLQGKQAPADAAGRPTVIRRRKKVVEEALVDDVAEVQVGDETEAAPELEAKPGDYVADSEEDQEAVSEVEISPEVEAKVEAAEEPAVEAEPPEEREFKVIEEAGAEEVEAVVTEAEGLLSGKAELSESESVEVEEPTLEETTADSVEETVAIEETEEPEVGDSVSMEALMIDRAAEPAQKTEIKFQGKVKRIEKTTAEPARIISRPPIPTPPPPPKPEPQVRHETRAPEPKPVLPVLEPVLPMEQPETVLTATEADLKKSKRKKKSRDADTSEVDGARKKSIRRREIIEKTDLYDKDGWDRPSRGKKGLRAQKKIRKTEITVPKAIKRRIKVVEAISVADLAKKMGIKSGDIIRKLMTMGVMANVNQAIDFDTAALVATEFDYEVEKGSFDEDTALQVEERDEAKKHFRPPVVTVMGHVDHGKTSLLDAIRKTNVIEGEAGGITQHIGAYHVEVEGGKVTFLDTPGHAAFTAMRARGAQVTDIVVLIVAADDGVMQQTREAADHAKAAGVPIIVAVNKIDKPDADTERIRREVSDLGLVPEEWGGDTIFADVSAKTGKGVPELLGLILLQAEMLELKASYEGRAQGRIIEARLDKGRGPVATLLVQDGMLSQGDSYVCGVFHGRVRAMFDDKGQRVEKAGPSIPVEIQGLSGVPQAGDAFVVVGDDKRAKQVSEHRQLKQRETELLKTSKLTLETLFDSIKEGAIKDLNLVLKADVQGSLEAITDALHKLATEDIKVNIIHSSTGAISETDISLASASHALVVGFNVRPNAKVQDMADQEGVQIRFYDVIYRLIDEIKVAMVGLLEPIKEEKVLGRAEVREAFHVSKVGTIAGSSVSDGKIVRGGRARLLRDNVVVYDGKVISLKRFKDDAKEVLSGYECGIGLENFNDIKAGDVIEAYIVEERAATLD